MDNLKPTSSVSTDVNRNEVYFSISGFWDLEGMQSFIHELDKGAYPIVKKDGNILALGNMSGFVPQTRETGDVIRNHLMKSKEFGLTRVAIYGASSLVKLQYTRLSNGVEVEFFDGKIEAVNWLRRP